MDFRPLMGGQRIKEKPKRRRSKKGNKSLCCRQAGRWGDMAFELEKEQSRLTKRWKATEGIEDMAIQVTLMAQMGKRKVKQGVKSLQKVLPAQQ